MNIERLFQILAVILAGIAAYFLWNKNGDGAFVSSVLGAVSFFLSVRFQVKERNRQRELAEEKARAELSDGAFFEDELFEEKEKAVKANEL